MAQKRLFSTWWKRTETLGVAATMRTSNQPVLVKRYAERRFYRPDAQSYLSREHLIAMGKRGEPFVVVDAKTGADVTSAFRPIIVEH
jgi:polyhydroxyalkanoate synthesis regulator protein